MDGFLDFLHFLPRGVALDGIGGPGFTTTSRRGMSGFGRGKQKAFVYFIFGGQVAVFMGFIRVLCGGFSYLVTSLFWAG